MFTIFPFFYKDESPQGMPPVEIMHPNLISRPNDIIDEDYEKLIFTSQRMARPVHSLITWFPLQLTSGFYELSRSVTIKSLNSRELTMSHRLIGTTGRPPDGTISRRSVSPRPTVKILRCADRMTQSSDRNAIPRPFDEYKNYGWIMVISTLSSNC